MKLLEDKNRELLEITISIVIKLYLKGLSEREIADACYLSVDRVRQIIDLYKKTKKKDSCESLFV